MIDTKVPDQSSPAEQIALAIVREQIPQLAVAYDFKESFFGIYDEPDKQKAQNAFEAWENSLPSEGAGCIQEVGENCP